MVVISPHSPRRFGAFGIWNGSRLRGNFGQFGFPGAVLDLPNDVALAVELKTHIGRAGLQTWDIPQQPLDHGALVPLWYLAEAGWDGPTAVLSLNYPGERGLKELGGALTSAAIGLKQRLAVIASGDMSHRLTRDAPAGYDPRACDFDREFIECLRLGAYHDLEHINQELQELAGEDALERV